MSNEGGRSTREQILDAAGPIFAEQGYQAATVREICGAARVNVAAINYYFGDKLRLYVETVRHAYRQRLQQVPFPMWSDGMTAPDRLYRFVRALLTRMLGVDEAPWQVRLMIREVLQPTEACRTLVEDYFRPQFNLLLEILDELVPLGMTLAERRHIAFSIVGQCVYYRVAGEVVGMVVGPQEQSRHFTVDALARHIAGFSLRALGHALPAPIDENDSYADLTNRQSLRSL